MSEEDVAAVVEVLRSDWLTTGPKVEAFERAFAETAGARHAVAVSTGTAALHTAMDALAVAPGDEVIVPAITFVASANAVVFQGGTPVVVDVDPGRLLIDPEAAAARVTPRTKAILTVDYAGHPCDYDALQHIADRYGIAVVADACHALGGSYRGRPVGGLARLSTFSLHPVKAITAGEGGVVTTDDDGLAARMRSFRNHGIATSFRQREALGSWRYEMERLGYNYRLSDIQCALALSQLQRLDEWTRRRQELARRYDEGLARLGGVSPLTVEPHVSHGRHLYVVLLDDALRGRRDAIFRQMRGAGIGVNVHYLPVHLHRFYRERIGGRVGQCPVAESAFARLLTLPLFPRMQDEDIDRVVGALADALASA